MCGILARADEILKETEWHAFFRYNLEAKVACTVVYLKLEKSHIPVDGKQFKGKTYHHHTTVERLHQKQS